MAFLSELNGAYPSVHLIEWTCFSYHVVQMRMYNQPTKLKGKAMLSTRHYFYVRELSDIVVKSPCLSFRGYAEN